MALAIFTCWAEMPTGAMQRLEVTATTASDARQLAFAECPRALAVSCRAMLPVFEESRHG